MIDVTVLGTVKRRQALTRGGARAGDELYVSGTIGAAAAGLQMLQARAGRRHRRRTDRAGAESCIERYLYPEPRVRLGLAARRGTAPPSACMDLERRAGRRRAPDRRGERRRRDDRRGRAADRARRARAWFERAAPTR